MPVSADGLGIVYGSTIKLNIYSQKNANAIFVNFSTIKNQIVHVSCKSI